MSFFIAIDTYIMATQPIPRTIKLNYAPQLLFYFIVSIVTLVLIAIQNVGNTTQILRGNIHM